MKKEIKTVEKTEIGKVTKNYKKDYQRNTPKFFLKKSLLKQFKLINFKVRNFPMFCKITSLGIFKNSKLAIKLKGQKNILPKIE